MRIKELRIENYKIFKTINILFNDNVNILLEKMIQAKQQFLKHCLWFLLEKSTEDPFSLG